MTTHELCKICDKTHVGPWCPLCSPDNYCKWLLEVDKSSLSEHSQYERTGNDRTLECDMWSVKGKW